MNTRVDPLRAGLAIVTAIALALAMMMVFTGSSAQAALVDATTCDDAGFPEANKEGAAVGEISNGWGSATWDDDEDTTLEVDMNDGWSVEICVKAGDEVHVFTVTADTVLGPFDNGISHASWRNATESTTTTVAEETTTTVAEETTTTVAEETTTTVAEETTTTVAEETTTTVADTTTTIEDEVLGTVITTSTTAPAVQVTTTIADEVLGTHVEAEELPFTGIDSDQLVGMGVLLLASGLVMLVATGRREES